MDEAPNYGMRFAVPLQWSAVALTEISLRKFFRENWWLQVLIVVLPSDKWGYFQVKQHAELSAGCLTQCIKMDTIRRMDKVIAKYLLLKINSKTNGVNHTIANLPLVTHQPCMVMGATMTPPKTLKTPIVVAVTASEDLTATTYNTTFTLQNPKKSSLSTIEQLKTITIEKLRAFVARNNAFPARIYYYRESAIDKIEEGGGGDQERVRRRLQRVPHRAHDGPGAEVPPHQVLLRGKRDGLQSAAWDLRGQRRHGPDRPELLPAVPRYSGGRGQAHKVPHHLRRQQFDQ
jgi:hypothetical protein